MKFSKMKVCLLIIYLNIIHDKNVQQSYEYENRVDR